VVNNPLKYRDPTGHVKFTFKLKNTGKKAVELNVGKYTKISESVPLLNLNMRRIRIIRNEILKSDMFRKLGALKSSTKLYYDNDPCYLEVHKEIEALRDSIKVHVADIEKKYGISLKI
jgi:hypothetical protein